MPHLSELQMLLALLSGGIVGFILGLIGGGGSILAVPLLLYLVGFHDAHVVIGSTAFAVAVNAFLNLIPHWRAGNVRWRSAIAFAIPGAIGAYAGSVFGKMVNDKVILFLFAILMIVIAILMLRPKKQIAGSAPGQSKLPRIVPTGLSTGLLSGFFGIGGGFLIVPGLVFSAGLTMAEAIGTSLFSVGAFGVTTAFSYAASGMVDWLVVALYIAGGVIGGFLGVRSCSALGRNVRRLQIIFSSIIILVAFYMLYMNLEAMKSLHWEGGIHVNWTLLVVVVVVVVVGYLAYRMLPVRGVKSIPSEEVETLLSKEKATVQFVDVREPGEFRTGHVPGFKNIPLSQLKSRLKEMNTERTVVLMCRSGARSQQAARTLVKQGFADVRNASGGMMAWKGRQEK